MNLALSPQDFGELVAVLARSTHAKANDWIVRVARGAHDARLGDEPAPLALTPPRGRVTPPALTRPKKTHGAPKLCGETRERMKVDVLDALTKARGPLPTSALIARVAGMKFLQRSQVTSLLYAMQAEGFILHEHRNAPWRLRVEAPPASSPNGVAAPPKDSAHAP